MSRTELGLAGPGGPMGPVVLDWEPWAAIWPEALPLMQVHHDEVGAEALGVLDVDVAAAEAMDSMGVLRIATARAGGALIGYCMWYLTPNVESKGMLLAQQGPWYAQGLGLRLLDFCLEALPSMGARVALLHHWAGNERLGTLLVRRYGARELERVFYVILKERA